MRLGPQIQWVQRYVTGDTIHRVYIAPSEREIREHAEQAGFPASKILEVDHRFYDCLGLREIAGVRGAAYPRFSRYDLVS